MPIETVGVPFSIRMTVKGEHVARSAIYAILKSRLNRAKRICSPTNCMFFSSLRGSLVPIVFFLAYVILIKV